MIHMTLIQQIAVSLLPILFAITLHEAAHGWVASKLGDKTALILGRVTLNPFKHIDLIGTILIPLILLFLNSGFIFGWAKPVPINSANLRNPRRDLMLIAAAGPLANLLMAFGWAGILKIGLLLGHHGIASSIPIIYMGKAGIFINCVLMALNLVPLPPLDGGRIVSGLLPPRLAYRYERIEPYSLLILLVLLASNLLSWIISPLVAIVLRLISALFGLGID